MTLDYNQQRKLQLIEDILKILFKQVELVHFNESQRASFVKQWPGNPKIFRLMEIKWDNKFNFQVSEYIGKDWRGVYIPTSAWFEVRDLIRRRFLDAEKLKISFEKETA